jgi:predicted TIM-barrel fold metal-dependent hydrolase
VIDAHVHVVSSDQARYPLRPAPEDDVARAHVVSFPAEDLVAEQHDCGVAGAVLVQSFAAYGYENHYAADAAEAHPDRFVFVAGVDPEAPDVLDRARHWIEDCGARGLRVLSFSEGLDPERYRSFWQLANAHRTPICVLMPLANLLALKPLIQTFPELPVVLDHCGLQPLDATRADLGCPDLMALAELPALQMKISSRVFDAVSGSVTEAITRLLDRFGSERVLWGSDFPASPAPSYGRAIERAREVMEGFAESVREPILDGNTRRLFRLGGAGDGETG